MSSHRDRPFTRSRAQIRMFVGTPLYTKAVMAGTVVERYANVWSSPSASTYSASERTSAKMEIRAAWSFQSTRRRAPFPHTGFQAAVRLSGYLAFHLPRTSATEAPVGAADRSLARRLRRLHVTRLDVTYFVSAVAAQHRPDDPSQLVGQCHHGGVHVGSRQQPA